VRRSWMRRAIDIGHEGSDKQMIYIHLGRQSKQPRESKSKNRQMHTTSSQGANKSIISKYLSNTSNERGNVIALNEEFKAGIGTMKGQNMKERRRTQDKV
jgi:hypothetical protein